MPHTRKLMMKIQQKPDGFGQTHRMHSNPTLEEVIAQQTSNKTTPAVILPQPIESSKRPSLGHHETLNHKGRPSSDNPRARQNRCPLPGTEEAKNRTINASLARCKSEKKRQEFLQKRGLTEEDVKKMALKPKKLFRPIEKETNWGHEQTAISTPSIRNEYGISERSTSFRNVTCNLRECSVNNSHVYEAATRIREYYSGRGRPHLFCVISRFGHMEERYNVSSPYDYLCVSATRHPLLSGNGALQFLLEILSAVQSNPGPIRCELQQASQMIKEGFGLPRFILLDSILVACCASTSVTDLEILGSRTILSNPKCFDDATFVIDITDPSDPKYCYLYNQNGYVRTLCYPPKDLGYDYHHAPVLLTPETYTYIHFLATYRLVNLHAILSAWPFLAPQRVPPPPYYVNWTDIGTVVAYDNPWPIKYPTELDDPDFLHSRKPEEIFTRLTEVIGYPRNEQYMDLVHVYLPFAPFMTPQLLMYLMEFYRKLQELTMAGNNIFMSTAVCEMFQYTRRRLVYLNLLSCQIPEDGLATIREIETLDTFLHESTVIPGLRGIYQPSRVEGNRKSLKICLTYVWDNGYLTDYKLSELLEQYTICGDTSILGQANLSYADYGFQHPFMGPVSAVSCLKALVTKLHDTGFSPEQLNYFTFFKGIFSRGYHPKTRIGLPVTLSREQCQSNEVDQGTRLNVTCCRGEIYASFSHSTDTPGSRVLEKLSVYDYLLRYKGLFQLDTVGDLMGICESLLDWCGNGFRIPRHEDIIRPPRTESQTQMLQWQMIRDRDLASAGEQELDDLSIPALSIPSDESSVEDTEIEE